MRWAWISMLRLPSIICSLLPPVDSNAFYAIGRVEFSLGKLVEAEVAMKSYLQAHPQDASAHYGLGRVYLQGLQFDRARAEFERSIALQPLQSEAYYELGETSLDQGRYAEAIAFFEKALVRNPEHGGALAGIGTASFKQKQYQEAETWLQRAIKAAPDYQPGHYYLGLTFSPVWEGRKMLGESLKLLPRSQQRTARRRRRGCGFTARRRSSEIGAATSWYHVPRTRPHQGSLGRHSMKAPEQALAPAETARHMIARRAALELRDGDYVNLGIGLPTLVASYLPAGLEITLQSENGMLGVGPYPYEGEEDADLINAGKETVEAVPDTSYFSSADAFAMIRGGHMDVTILGAMEVDAEGSIANWTIPGKVVKGMGGAMDLVAGTKRVIVAMEHTTKDGSPRILKRCTLPLTGVGVVQTIITEKAVFSVGPNGLCLKELIGSCSVDDVIAATEAQVIVDPALLAGAGS